MLQSFITHLESFRGSYHNMKRALEIEEFSGNVSLNDLSDIYHQVISVAKKFVLENRVETTKEPKPEIKEFLNLQQKAYVVARRRARTLNGQAKEMGVKPFEFSVGDVVRYTGRRH